MIPRALPQAHTTAANLLDRADLECVPLAGRSDAAPVREWLLACAALGDMSAVPYRRPDAASTAVDAYFGEACWQARALSAYCRISAHLSAADHAELRPWFLACARYHADHIDHTYFGLSAVFPGRPQSNYLDRKGPALSGTDIGRAGHQQGVPLSWLSQYYNNRRALAAFYCGMAGIVFEDQPLIDCAKRYQREWLMFSVYADGTQGELARNGSWGHLSGGWLYAHINTTAAILLACWLAQRGDTELLDYSTTSGLHGTESSAPKSIWTTWDAIVSLVDGSRAWLTTDSKPFDWGRNPYGWLNHPSWVWPAIKDTLRYSTMRGWMRALRTTRVEDPYGLWRGLCGIYVDVRTEDISAPITLAGGRGRRAAGR